MTDKQVDIKEFEELVKRVEKLEKESTFKEWSGLQVARIRPSYNYYDDGPSVTPRSLFDNIFHRTSRQLKEHLKMNGFCVDTVSRVDLGSKEYYKVEFNMTKEDFHNKKNDHSQIKKLLDVKGVGLADFFTHDDKIHTVILVDEKELNDKYLENGNLHF